MNYIRSRTKSDCVIASVAMVCGESYKTVKDAHGPVKGGIELAEIEWLLERFGQPHRLVRLRKPRPLQKIVKEYPNSLVLMETSDFFGEVTHAVAVVDGVAYDPSGANATRKRVIGVWK